MFSLRNKGDEDSVLVSCILETEFTVSSCNGVKSDSTWVLSLKTSSLAL